MFERQIRLSRYDCDKLSNTFMSTNSRLNNQNRDIRSPNRSRSISPNDMALRQRRTAPLPTSILPPSSSSTTTILSLPVSTSYPDLVISHTPPTSSHIETNNKTMNEQTVKNISADETATIDSDNNRSNLLVSSTSSSDTADDQLLDFKSRLALFKKRSNENCHIKKPSNSVPQPNFLTKPIVHHHHHHSDKKDVPSVVNTTKSITFFGGTKVNGNTKSTLPSSEPAPLPSITINEQSSLSTSIDLIRVPDVIGGNVKLNKSSIFSGMKKVFKGSFIRISFLLYLYNLGCSSTIY